MAERKTVVSDNHHKGDSFSERIYTVLAAIPKGKVITYGILARLADAPRRARHVGQVLHRLPRDTALPWFRVVNHSGKISMTGEGEKRQKELLEQEGVIFSHDGKIDLKRFGWPDS